MAETFKYGIYSVKHGAHLASGQASVQSAKLPRCSTLEPLEQREPEELYPGEEPGSERAARQHTASQIRCELFASLLKDLAGKKDLSETPEKEDVDSWKGGFPG